MSGHLLGWSRRSRRRVRVGKVVSGMQLEKNREVLLRDPSVFESVLNAGPVSLSSFEKGHTGLIVVDMINGFATEGPLSSSNTAEIIAPVAKLMKACREQKIPMVFFADTHTGESPEFGSYPVHCMAGTSQSCPVQELEAVGGYTLIPKNSTNGFLEPAFDKWLKEHPEITCFLVVGCCTDICIQQFALTLKTEFNRINRSSRVVVPVSMTATYDAPGHPAALIELASYLNMQTSGVEIVSDIGIE